MDDTQKLNSVAASANSSPRSSDVPRCPLTSEAMRHWHHVPMDCKKGEPNAYCDVYYSKGGRYGHVYPLPTASEVGQFYELDSYYTHGQSHFAGEGKRTFADRVREHMAWRLDGGQPLGPEFVHRWLKERPSRICDIGCGSGSFAEELVHLGHELTGVEVDPRALSSELGDQIRFFAGTAEQLPLDLEQGSYDAVIMSHVLEHCVDPSLALRNAYGLLRDGGVLFCEVPNCDARALVRRGFAWEMFDVPRHLHFFTKDSLRAFTEKAGLRVQQTTFAHYLRSFSNVWINTERELWSRGQRPGMCPEPMPARNSKWRAWCLLAETALARPRYRYDSVCVVAQRS